MGDTINPGPGWREVPAAQTGNETSLLLHDGPVIRRWVREAPVPPLPTAPGTVIAIGEWWFVKNRPWMPGTNLEHDQGWTLLLAPSEIVQRSMSRASFGFKAGDVYDNETVTAEFEQEGAFVVVSEPRANTAKAVLDRVRETQPQDDRFDGWLKVVAREFGVTS